MTAAPPNGGTGVICPACGEPAVAGDSFCESCGTELAPPLASNGPARYTAQCPVCSLDGSALPAGISADGYCQACGRKVPSGRDHVELNLGLLAGVTDRGLRHRRNEDAMALAATDTPAGPAAIAVVCDGVSSSPRPDDASLAGAQAAVRMLLAAVRRGDDPGEASLAAIRQAHEAVAILGSASQAPSATYISAIVGPDGVTVCWLGDSRAYWLATE
ncbi:MAG: protein phosphatase 2C domain-containing protein, partial [Actinobacteria bacterium]|nr:protein phosphatase 2C domain-containing protein [Actinomycetota bacterium]